MARGYERFKSDKEHGPVRPTAVLRRAKKGAFGAAIRKAPGLSLWIQAAGAPVASRMSENSRASRNLCFIRSRIWFARSAFHLYSCPRSSCAQDPFGRCSSLLGARPGDEGPGARPRRPPRAVDAAAGAGVAHGSGRPAARDFASERSAALTCAPRSARLAALASAISPHDA